jgi:parallel beta-helix repeat protein
MAGIILLFLLLVQGVCADGQIWSPTTIITPGTWTLQNDIVTSVNPCITIQASDVVFDGMGYRIDSSAVGSGTGILVQGSNVTVKNVTVSDWYDGIYYQDAPNGIITNTTVSSISQSGIVIQSTNLTITGNRVTGNSGYGLSFYIGASWAYNNNRIYNNYFNNSNNIYPFDTNNVWNTTLTPGTNIVGGSLMGGNYYAQPDGNGFSQTHGDSDGNGICDEVYGPDYLPLQASPVSYDITVPGYITSPGTYYLHNDILTGSSNAIQIVSGNVTFDGMGHRIDGSGSGGGQDGIYVTKPNVTVQNVTVTDWSYGIYYNSAPNGTIDRVNASSNGNDGIHLESSSGVAINGSQMSGNSGNGIYLDYINGMTLANSRVTGNSGTGIYFYYSNNGDTIYNNYFNNTNNAGNYYGPSGMIWNTTLTPGTNIVGGSLIGGNYWAQPNGLGFSQTDGDSNNIGICDDAYGLPGGYDQLALHTPPASYDITGPGYIISPGTYYLRNDITTTATAIQIVSANVIFDGMGHRIDGSGSAGGWNGIYVTKPNVTVQNVTVTDWSSSGILYENAPNSTTEGVNASSNGQYGIYYYYGPNSTIDRVNASSNGGDGIYYYYAPNDIIDRVDTRSNGGQGIHFESSSGVAINGSQVSGNSQNGIYLGSTNGMTLTNSRVTGNSGTGIYFFSSYGDTIYNNYFNNTNNAGNYYGPSGMIWNTTLTPGTNIVGGSLIGGNYWAQPNGIGFSQTDGDSNNIGICDDVYGLPGGSDQLALHIQSFAYNITGPGYIISPGTYYLRNDILTGSSNAIQITSGNVIFDGMGYRVDSSNPGSGNGILVTKPNVTVENVTLTNWSSGIYYQNAPDGFIMNTTTSSNYNGIGIQSPNLTITGNRLTNNIYGVNIYAGWTGTYNNNRIFNNYFNNSNNVYGFDTNNIWNTTQTPGTNIVGGSLIGGNYWAQPNGLGFSQTNGDSNNDGICDDAYVPDQLPLHINPAMYNITGPGYIVSPGTYYLQNDITPTTTAIHITSGNVIFDGMGHKIDGSGSGGGQDGIDVTKFNVTVRNVTVTNWGAQGIYYNNAPNGTIEGVNVSNCANVGILLASASSGVAVNGSRVSGSSNGIYTQWTDSVTLTNNWVTGNTGSGIYLYFSNGNTIYNNYFNNSNNIGGYYSNPDYWNTTLTPGTNIVGGPWLGGNYYARPDGNGYSQTDWDSNNDGICNDWYGSGVGGYDQLPLHMVVAPARWVIPGGTVYVGESGLDITGCMAGNTTLAWWPAGADPTSTSPATTMGISSTVHNFVVSPAGFSNMTGPWYSYDGSPGGSQYLAFRVVNPAVDIAIRDITTGGLNVTRKTAPVGDELGFAITNNIENISAERNITGIPFDILLTGPDGRNIPTLVNTTGTVSSLTNITLPISQYDTGGFWNTGNTLYPTGTYTVQVEAETTLNGMRGTSVNRTVTLSNTPALVLPAPVIASVPTASGYRNSTVAFTIMGSNFEPGLGNTTVEFRNQSTGVIPTALTNVTITRIDGTLAIPLNATTGSWNIRVITADGGENIKFNAFSVVNLSKPTIAAVTPATTWYRNTTVPFVITGTNFEPGLTTISFNYPSNGTALNRTNGFTVNTVTATTINGTVVVPYDAPTGAWNVSVTTADGGTLWKSSAFTVTRFVKPTITAVTPATTWYRNATVSFAITGTNFQPGQTTVSFNYPLNGTALNRTNGFTVNTVTATTINGTVVVPYDAPTGAWNVSVTTLDGGTIWKPSTFTVTRFVKPTITAVTPATAWYLNATVPFVITGTNFQPGQTTVSFNYPSNGTALNRTNGFTVNTVTATTINGTVVVPYDAPTGGWNVSVTTLDGGTIWKPSAFTVTRFVKPTITAVTPATTWYRNATVPFLITGTNFQPGQTTVSFNYPSNGTALNRTNGFTVNTVTATTINGTVVVPYNAPTGSWNVSVTTLDGGTIWKASTFTVGTFPAPTITSITPVSGFRNTSVSYTITGTNFEPGQTRVVLSNSTSGELASTVYSVTSTQITGAFGISSTTPTGTWRLNVSTLDGGLASKPSAFTVNTLPVPSITSFTPSTAYRGTPVSFIVNGNYFQPGGLTTVNLTKAGQTDIQTTLTSVFSSQITGTVTIPAGNTTGSWKVNVTTVDGGVGTKPNAITVL